MSGLSVDILGPAEPSTRSELDPKRYGVIVSRGGRRGLLLPDLEGVDTVEEQLSIALQKAGIKPDEDYQIERFEVIRYT
jgi:AMMECR1 domain-containing protein